MNNKTESTKSISLLIIVVLSTISGLVIFNYYSTNIQNNSTDTTVLLAENDNYIQTAYDLFKKGVNNKFEYKVIDDLSHVEKESSIIIFGHGTPEGLFIQSELVPWNDIGSQLSSNKNLKNVAVIACYGDNLNKFMASMSIIGFEGDLDAKIGGYAAAISGLEFNDLLVEKNARNILNNYYSRLNELESGEKPLNLSKRYSAIEKVNTIPFTGIPIESYTHMRIRLTGSDSSAFYLAFLTLVGGLGIVRSWFLSGVLTAFGTALAASFALVTLALVTEIFIQLIIIRLSSPYDSAYFGWYANTLPLVFSGIIAGYNTFEPPSIQMSAFAYLIYLATKEVSTNGRFVFF